MGRLVGPVRAAWGVEVSRSAGQQQAGPEGSAGFSARDPCATALDGTPRDVGRAGVQPGRLLRWGAGGKARCRCSWMTGSQEGP